MANDTSKKVKEKPDIYYIEHFLAQTKVVGSCLVWQGSINWSSNILSYARAKVNGKNIYVHRWMAEIPDGLDSDHLCRNTLCINPYHIEAVTHKENVHRGKTGGSQTDCISCGSNDWRYRSGSGYRYCNPCKKESNKKWYRKTPTVHL